MLLLPTDVWRRLPGLHRLSDRELQIVQGIFVGQDQQHIALALGIGEDLVYRTIQRIYIKLRIGSRLELISRVRSEYMKFVINNTRAEACDRFSSIAHAPVNAA
jgi:DNA-binding CsgD family transcriptional regulator